MRVLWDRIRHRKVVQWTLAYAAVAWALVQVLDFSVSTFDWPANLTRIAAVLSVIGLPVTIVLAWFHGDRGRQRVSRIELLLLAGFALGGALLARQVATGPAKPVQPAAQHAPAEQTAAERSAQLGRPRIAVLPFANLGDDPANKGFTDGVHDTLITQVAKVPGLTVISRSSVLQFEGKQFTIADVAAALDVNAVLEGSVQRDGRRVLIQTQLIDASTDAHLWAETFDRTSDDLFAVQTEIAQAVTEQLRIRLSAGDERRLATVLTSNPRAYEHYALGRSLMSRGSLGAAQSYEQAIAEFATAVTLDPRFAAAHAQMSIARTWLAFQNPVRRAELLPLAKASAERALQLDPTLPDGHLAQGVYFYRGEPDLPAAAAEFARAIAGLPNDAFAHRNLGFLRAYEGRFEEAAALFARAAELDPSGPAGRSLVSTLSILGRRDAALQVVTRTIAAQPDNVEFALLRGQLRMDFDCDLAAVESNLRAIPRRHAQHPDVLHDWWWFHLTTGNYAKAVEYAERWAELDSAEVPDHQLGWSYALAGRSSDAEARLQRSLEGNLRAVASMPQGDAVASTLAFIAREHALLGNAAEAIEFANRAVAALPTTGAVRQRPLVLLLSASALAQAGDIDDARRLMRQMLELPAEIKPSGIWCTPNMAPLRTDPEFREMMAGHGANVGVDPHRRETWPPPSE